MLNSAEEIGLLVSYHPSLVSVLALKQLNTVLVLLKLLEHNPLFTKA